MEAPLDGGGDASLLPPAARAGMVRRRRLKFTRRSSLFFIHLSNPLECKCFHRVETDIIAFSLSLFVVVIVVVSFVKRVSRGVVSLTTRSLSSLSISPPYIVLRARLREQEPTTSGDTTTENEGTFKTDFKNLPLPCKYENLQTEMLMSLKADFFEGARFDYNKQLNQKFFLSHGFSMTNAEIPAASGHIIKIPSSSYEFGANVVDTNYMLVGRVFTDGRVSGRVKYDATENLSFRLQTSKEREYSQLMLDVDVKGLEWQAQAKCGSGEFYGVNYIQSVTERVALGGEGFYLGANQGGKSGVGFAARYNDDDVIATAQVATTGMCSLTYCQKVGEKAMLASDFSWNWNHRQASGSVGYDYVLRQCRLRGSIDNQGVVGMFLEERLSMGLNLIFSAQIDHATKNHKFGYGMTVGE